MEKPIEFISKKYEDLYKNQNYSLAASTDLYVPWMKCTLHCKHRTRQPLSELDAIIIKCVKNSINTIRDLSFVLGIDEILIEAETEILADSSLLEKIDDKIGITKTGEESYAEKMKDEIVTEEFPVYMNCITGQWSVAERDFISEKQVRPQNIQKNQKVSEIQPIVLELKRGVTKEDVQNDVQLVKDLNTKYNTQIISAHLMNDRKIQYQADRVLFFRNENKNIIFALCDYEMLELDDKLAAALRENYERRQLLEILQVEKFTKEAEKYLPSEEPVVVQYKKQICGDRYLRNQDIRKLFKEIFEQAEKNIFIIVPWIDHNNYVMTEDILNKMELALKRNIAITIGYGYTNRDKLKKRADQYRNASPDDEKVKKDRDYQTYLMAEKMKNRFSQYEKFKIFHVGTHEKILAYDDKFTLISSYNFMSYDGGESEDYKGYNFRFEGGVLIEDMDFFKHIKKCFGE